MSTPEPAPRETTAVVLARIEGKLDVVAVQLTTIARTQDDHEARIRALTSALPDRLDERLREVEGRATVSPRALAAALVTAVGVVASLSPLLARIYGG